MGMEEAVWTYFTIPSVESGEPAVTYNCERAFWWNSSDFDEIGEDLDSAYEYIKGCGWHPSWCGHANTCSSSYSSSNTWRAVLCCPSSTTEGYPYDECNDDPLAVQVIYVDRFNSELYFSSGREACESLPQNCGDTPPVRCPGTNNFGCCSDYQSWCGDDGYEDNLSATYGSVAAAPTIGIGGIVEQPKSVPEISPPSAVVVPPGQEGPPIPQNGLPEGWTMEQWKHYGHQWLENQG